MPMEFIHSILKEVSSILTCSFLNAVAKMTDVYITISVPKLLIDMPGAIIDCVLIELSKEEDYSVVFETVLEVKEYKIKSYFTFVAALCNLKKIFNVFEKYGGKGGVL